MKTKMINKKMIGLILILIFSLFLTTGCSSAVSKETAEYEYNGKNGYFNVYLKNACLIKHNNTVYAAFNVYQKFDDEFNSYVMREINDTNFYFGLSEGEKQFEDLNYETGYTGNSVTLDNSEVNAYAKNKYPSMSATNEYTNYTFVDLTKSNMTAEIFDQLKAENDLTAVQIGFFSNDLDFYLHIYPDELVDLDAE